VVVAIRGAGVVAGWVTGNADGEYDEHPVIPSERIIKNVIHTIMKTIEYF